MSQTSPQQVYAQSYERAFARMLYELFPGKPLKKIRPSLEYVDGVKADVMPRFDSPRPWHLKTAQEAVKGFESAILPICRDNVKAVLLGDRNLAEDRRDVIVQYEDGTELAFDLKGNPSRPEGVIDITSPRSSTLFYTVKAPGAYKGVRERLLQRDLVLKQLKSGKLKPFVGKLLGKYNYWVVDIGKKRIHPWGPSLEEYEWSAMESEVEFRGKTYPAIDLHCSTLATRINICPRRKETDSPNLKWHTTCSGDMVKSYGILNKTPSEDIF